MDIFYLIFNYMKTLFIIFIFMTNVYAQNNDLYDKAIVLKNDLINGKKHYKLCATCHLKNGIGKKDGSFPVIAGQHKSVILKQLQDIQNKLRYNPTMYPFTDIKTIGGVQVMSDIAAYINSMPNLNANGTGSGKYLTAGEALYQQNCSYCHGRYAHGNAQKTIPKLSNQHYKYLLRQLKWIRDDYRKNADIIMRAILKNMSNEDFRAIADYISNLK